MIIRPDSPLVEQFPVSRSFWEMFYDFTLLSLCEIDALVLCKIANGSFYSILANLSSNDLHRPVETSREIKFNAKIHNYPSRKKKLVFHLSS